MSDELAEAIVLSNKLLDEPNCDPDDDLRTLARQLMRRNELVDHLLQALLKYGRHKSDCQMYGLHHCTCGWYGEYLRRDELIRKQAALAVPETEVKS